MAHNLMTRDGQAAMFYVGEAPWHGLGTKLNHPPTAEEAIRAAQLDWDVAKAPLYMFGKSRLVPFPGKYAVVPADRLGSDDCPVFGLVGEHYQPLQNRAAFSFFDPIVADGYATYHTAGALGDGERVWVLVQLDGEILVANSDRVQKYVLLSNSHDGDGSVQLKFTPIRVVCQNTLTQALSRGKTIRVPHTSTMHERLEHARELMALINTTFDDLGRRYEEMVNLRLDDSRLTRYLAAVFPMPRGAKNAAAVKRVETNRRWAEYFFESGQGNRSPEVAGTLWAAYNGIVELVDHCDQRRIPSSGPDPRRLESAWFGDGYLVKARAYAAAEEELTGLART